MEELATTLYAKSMFDASKEDDCLKLVYEELNLVKETIDSNPRLMEVFKHPLLSNIDNNILNGTIITRNSLSDDEISKYEEKLTTSLKSHVKLKNVLDDTIIGGAIVKIGDKLIDSTLKGQLNELRKELINNSEVRI